MNVQIKIINDLDPNTVLLGTKQRTDSINQIIAFIEGNSGPTIIGKNNFRNQIIPLSLCLSFYTAQKKVFVTTIDNRNLQVVQRLYELEESLPTHFIRISNTEIINLNFVTEFKVSPTGIIIIHFKNGAQTSSSRRYLKKIKERLL